VPNGPPILFINSEKSIKRLLEDGLQSFPSYEGINFSEV
jgi:hypothetical protein